MKNVGSVNLHFLNGFIKRPNMKILAIADLHNYITSCALSTIEKTKYDFCVLLGDIGERALSSLCSVLDLNKTYGILGNHDSFDLYQKFGIKELAFDNQVAPVSKYSSTTIKGLSGSVRYKQGDFPMLTQEESIKLCTHEKGDCDIVFSHDFPYKFYGEKGIFYCSHIGLRGINNYLQNINCPKLLVHGHYHRNTKTVYDRGVGYSQKSNPLVIGVYGCVLINYKTFTSKILFQP